MDYIPLPGGYHAHGFRKVGDLFFMLRIEQPLPGKTLLEHLQLLFKITGTDRTDTGNGK